jgi:hypothetical protein
MSVALCHGVRGFVLALPIALLLTAHDAATSQDALAQITEIPLPGGLAAARDAIDDRGAPDRALFLVELIERFYNRPEDAPDEGTPEVRLLLDRLKQSEPQRATSGTPADTIPLPLTPAWWIDVVFRGHARPETLAAAIVGSHDAALLYWGLLALDPATRGWLADRRDIVQALVRGEAARFVVVAPGLRVEHGQVRLPGGERAGAAWKAVVGASAADPAGFVRTLLADRDGRRANLYRSLSMLSDEHVSVLLRLRDQDPASSVDALQRLSGVFSRTGSNWSIPARPFFRQPVDPSSLIAAIPLGKDGRPALPGGEAFWSAVFEGEPERVDEAAKGPEFRGSPTREADRRKIARAKQEDATRDVDGPVDLVWLLEQVFDGTQARSRIRSDQVLFAARVFGEPRVRDIADVSVAVAATARYPALLRSLERLHVTDPVVYRRAVERASALDGISDRTTRVRAIAQFQSALALLVRAATHGSLSFADAAGLVSSLSAVETSEAGTYGGRLLRWIHDTLCSRADGSAPSDGVGLERSRADDVAVPPGAPDITEDLLRLLAGPPAAPSAEIVWEGARYRVDPAAAERARLERIRGEQPTPFLESAWKLYAMADRIDQRGRASTGLAREAQAFGAVARDMGWEDGAERDSSLPSDEIMRMLRDQSGARRGTVPANLPSRLRTVGDELCARGLMELAYAAALGDPGVNPITSEDAADRHDFGERSGAPASAAWRLPNPATPEGAWHLEGSMLDLDVCMAERWLTRVSLKPLRQPPSLQRADRQALVETVVILEPPSLSDGARDTIAAAVRAGRTRIAAAQASDLDAIADAVPLDPVRRSLLPWVFAHSRDRLVPFFSTADLVALGLQTREPRLDPWGAPAWPGQGCPCVRLPERWPRDRFTGHPDSGLIASAFPDLSFRLAEALADLDKPASLLPGVLAAATADLVDRAPSRYPGDMRGLVEHVQDLTKDEVEQYLALLTSGGPLVLVRENSGAASGSAP